MENNNVLNFLIKEEKQSKIQEIAKLLGVSEQSVYHVTQGKKNIPEDWKEILSKHFNIRLSFLGKELNLIDYAEYDETNPEFNVLEKKIIKKAKSVLIKNFTFSVALQPAANDEAQENLKYTIYNGFPTEELRPYIPNEQYKRIKETHGDFVKGWGVQAGVVKQFEKLMPGDTSLFAAEGKVFISGIVTEKVVSDELAKKLWPNSTEKPFSWIYLLKDIRNQDIAVEELNKVVGYKPNNRVQGFVVLDKAKSEKVLTVFDLENIVHQPLINQEAFEKELEWMEGDSLDKNRNSMGRLEQAFLRKQLFGNKSTAKCSCCHKVYPVQLMVCGHLKKRSYATMEEKRNPHIVGAFCVECDKYWELGLISVNENGEIIHKEKDESALPLTTSLVQKLDELAGNKFTHWNDYTTVFLTWHNQFHGFNKEG